MPEDVKTNLDPRNIKLHNTFVAYHHASTEIPSYTVS